MKDISPFIRELLYNHDCVILPGFGGFIGNYTPARIERDSHTFHPPVKAISFNSRLSHNDGLLIGKISEKKEIGYADAKNIVDDYISSLKDKLNKGARMHLAGIGHFQVNTEGNIQFEPDNDINYLLDAYGLSPFTREPVDDYDISKAVIRHRDRDPIAMANRRRMIWRAAAAIPFVLAIIIVPLKTDLFKSKVTLNPLAEVEFSEIQSAQEDLFDEMPKTKQAEVIKPEAVEEQTEITAATGEAEPASAVPAENVQTGVAAGNTVYNLIVGSFADADNANRLLNDLEVKGFDAEILRADNSYYRVSVKSCSTMQEAVEERRCLGESFTDIWIWKKDF
jgi:nucleoid DNA-binding protein